MTGSRPVPGVVLPGASHGWRNSGAVVGAPARRRLPLPQLPPPISAERTFYALTTIGGNGRLNDRAVPQRLGWTPGTRLEIQEDRGLIVVGPAPHGVFRVSAAGFILLPMAARRWCGLGGGDRVLLVADREGCWLVAHPPAAVDAMVAAAHERAWGGEPT